jgi:PAS domain S-box-containing protein
MSKALRILILEDRLVDADLVTRELRAAGFDFVAKTVATENEFLAELRNGAPQVILADYSLPGYDGLSALAAAQKECPETPFIFVSGSIGEEMAIETLHRGATDCVLKDRLARLGPAVRRALRECEEIRKKQQAEQRVRELNLVMQATGAINALMVRERDPQRLLAEACKILVETRGYRLAWIGLIETGSKRVVPAASAGKDADYLDAVTITWDENPAGQRPIGMAIRTGQSVTCQDIATDPLLAPYREAAKARGIASMAAMPMICGSRVLGAVAVFSECPGAFNEEELGLLKELVADLAFALQSIEQKQEQERAGDALRASEVRYRRLFESAKDGILILDAETGMVQDVNPYLTELLRISHQAFLGKKLWDLGFFKDIVANQAHFAELQQQEYIRYDDRALETADGRRIEVEFVSNVYSVNHEKVIQCNIRDVTERKGTEQRVRELNLLLRATGAVNALMVRERDPKRLLTEASQILVDTRGYQFVWVGLVEPSSKRVVPQARAGKDTGYFDALTITWDETPTGRGPIGAAIRTGQPVVCQDFATDPRLALWREDAKVRGVASMAAIPMIYGSRVLGAVAVYSGRAGAFDAEELGLLNELAHDLAFALQSIEHEQERKRSEESHARLATAVEQSAESIVITDAKGTILYANPAFEKISGYTRAEALGQNPRILKSGKHDAEFYRKMWAILLRGEVWSGRMINMKKDGTLYEEEATISPMRDPVGTVVNYVAVKRDVTHEAQLEDQLRQAQKMEAVGQLAGGVAHDFNNMLAIIRGNADLLLMGDQQLTTEAREGLMHVVEASERAANLTRQLLAFSRKQVLQPQPLVLNEVIASLTRMLNRVIGENINLRCDYAAPPQYIQGDPGMMEQVILNLVVNARDAMPQGGQLRVATEPARCDEAGAQANPEAHAGEFVCLRVSDTGTGIEPEILPRIFEPFFTTKEVGRGTGLGLATVYGIVKQHGGWIEVASQVGKGSTFKVFLPAIPTPARLAAAAEVGANLRGGHEMILLVEDDHAVRLTTRRVLESKGYRIQEATNAREALELWHSHAGEIALLLTDIIMPEQVTGRDLAEQLWRQRPRLKVIFMSGYSAEVLGKNTEFIRRTRSRFLQKPCSSRLLLETVRECLDEKTPESPTGEAPRAK